MDVLELALQNGFDNFEVEVSVDGKVVLRRQGVKTRYQVGLAETCTLNIEAGTHDVLVNLVDHDVQACISIDPDNTPYLGLNYDEGQLVFTPSATPFHYL